MISNEVRLPPVQRWPALTNSAVSENSAGKIGGIYNIAPDPPSDGFVGMIEISRLTGLFGQACSP